jgi:DNA-binding FadR family transcriptional regulator
MINEANVQVVRKFLLDSGAADGAKLPTERALAQTLGLTRGIIRGALAVMEAEGHLLRKVGSGTYLVKKEGVARAPAVLDVNPRQIVEARFAFEPYIAGIAAMNYTKQDMECLVQCAQEYHDADNFDAFEAADENFHTAIAAATHNPVVTSAYQSFAAAHAAAEWGGLRQRFLTAERRVASRKEHDRILAAIRSRDSEASIAAVRQHLDHIVSAILRQ